MNTVEGVRALPQAVGAEVDVRLHHGALVCAHDPFQPGDVLDDVLAAYVAAGPRGGPLVLNPKETGLEDPLLDLLGRHGLTSPHDVFLLDLTVPALVALTRRGESRVAVRVSEVEPLGHAEAFAGRARWAWLDCFDGVPAAMETVGALHEMEFRVCLVSPELEGYPAARIAAFQQLADACDPVRDAVCTKHPAAWGAP